LPFVYVFGRADFTVSYFGANIFPENIAVGLEQPEFENSITGKFVLEVRETGAGDSELHLAVELLPGIARQEKLASAVSERVRTEVIRINSEFAHYVPTQHQLPKVALRPYGDPEWFPLGVKHRYTRKHNA
jgi:phenylacetate-CoA ligase